jgi:hypothetical protein
MKTPKQTTAQNQPSKNASGFFNESIDKFGYLYNRWQDEMEYEDIKDYQLPLNPIAKKFGVTILKMNKRPFGCDFTVDGKTYKIAVSATRMQYRRIK